MDLTHVIVGPVLTEKSERLKGLRTYTLKVALQATKVDVARALERYYDVEVTSVRVSHVRSKTRLFGKGHLMEKRRSFKKALVTLAPKSKALDLASFKTVS
jgi:large subunit ribosomal protein L23